MRRSAGERIFDCINVLLLLGIMAVSIYPLLYVLNSSVSDPNELLRSRSLMLLPEGFQLEAYKAVFQNSKIYSGYLNTLFYVTVGTIVNLLMTSIAAYSLSRSDLFGRKTLMKLITFTMFFGGGMIPTFLLIQNLGMVDTRWAMIIPGAISTFYFLIMKTSFEGIPISLIESAKLDGANDILILFRIVLPLSKSILAVMTLYYAVDHWNDYVAPMLYLRSQDLYPIQIVMRDILISSSTESMGAGVDTGFAIGENIKYATIIISTLPIMLVYPFIQKYFVQGALIGAVKQ
ncbi:carbohydrate ABC transporter permease [Paenibacillus sp. FSL R5-0887]|jgi:putative aldouronate transport system permease protein|uniref:carbohydrate ABC transporter permease n=1 Tax=Paenibacillus TaxID=44249 RepID=UPI00096CC484|nr:MULTISPECIES: carbohydrate ABC transporter permease [Paenibacillus]MDH6428392.1 putative aldouronate transport system permease protein [Paenibacillus sp. PastH-4]MDH6443974.1 putative aldouronate transport system permease protein [Paenibacillus sp. PastF-4]MDH6527879.1 putative aldouronate transport system permease protein [Paenibacillus sp. PastH-3]OMC69816.1 sugar ABC transporter permease [Paenibacillus odorifer]OMD76203.1 sugar ABC transporter permease [Paenibacillus odorifer]